MCKDFEGERTSYDKDKRKTWETAFWDAGYNGMCVTIGEAEAKLYEEEQHYANLSEDHVKLCHENSELKKALRRCDNDHRMVL